MRVEATFPRTRIGSTPSACSSAAVSSAGVSPRMSRSRHARSERRETERDRLPDAPRPSGYAYRSALELIRLRQRVVHGRGGRNRLPADARSGSRTPLAANDDACPRRSRSSIFSSRTGELDGGGRCWISCGCARGTGTRNGGVAGRRGRRCRHVGSTMGEPSSGTVVRACSRRRAELVGRVATRSAPPRRHGHTYLQYASLACRPLRARGTRARRRGARHGLGQCGNEAAALDVRRRRTGDVRRPGAPRARVLGRRVPVGTALHATFVAGLLLQVPFALAAYVLARLCSFTGALAAFSAGEQRRGYGHAPRGRASRRAGPLSAQIGLAHRVGEGERYEELVSGVGGRGGLNGCGGACRHARMSLQETTPANGSVLERSPNQLRLASTSGRADPDLGADVRQRRPAVSRRSEAVGRRLVEVAVPTTLPDDAYTVAWRSYSGDSHPIRRRRRGARERRKGLARVCAGGPQLGLAVVAAARVRDLRDRPRIDHAQLRRGPPRTSAGAALRTT